MQFARRVTVITSPGRTNDPKLPKNIESKRDIKLNNYCVNQGKVCVFFFFFVWCVVGKVSLGERFKWFLDGQVFFSAINSGTTRNCS